MVTIMVPTKKTINAINVVSLLFYTIIKFKTIFMYKTNNIYITDTIMFK